MTKALLGSTKAAKQMNSSTVEEKLAMLNELPKVKTPPNLPGDANVKDYVLENVTPCKSSRNKNTPP
jgi:hypothetical protein